MKNLNEFFEVVLALEREHVDHFVKNVLDALWRSPLLLPVNFWLIDDSQAVFSFAAQGAIRRNTPSTRAIHRF